MSELREIARNRCSEYPIIRYNEYGDKEIVGTKCLLPRDAVDAIIDCAVAEAVLKVAELMNQSVNEMEND